MNARLLVQLAGWLTMGLSRPAFGVARLNWLAFRRWFELEAKAEVELQIALISRPKKSFARLCLAQACWAPGALSRALGRETRRATLEFSRRPLGAIAAGLLR